MASVNVFVYGTLMADQIAGKLLGRTPASSRATLSNYIRYRVKGVAFPAIISKAGEAVEGKVRMLLSTVTLRFTVVTWTSFLGDCTIQLSRDYCSF